MLSQQRASVVFGPCNHDVLEEVRVAFVFAFLKDVHIVSPSFDLIGCQVENPQGVQFDVQT